MMWHDARKVGIVKSEETSIPRQRISKHIPAASNAHATIEPVSKQRIDKRNSKGYRWKRRFLFGPCRMVIKKSSVEKSWLRFETPACQDVSLGAEELNRVESSELVVAE
jgi:hypothetical protein